MFSIRVKYVEPQGGFRPLGREDEEMSEKKLYVEQRPEGDYAVRKPDSDRASAVEPTQAEAIERAKELHPGAAIHVERVRNTSKGGRDKWRKP
jgi:hypothetical protein